MQTQTQTRYVFENAAGRVSVSPCDPGIVKIYKDKAQKGDAVYLGLYECEYRHPTTDLRGHWAPVRKLH